MCYDRRCLQALMYLHENRKTIHRDIKAGNILLTTSGDCKLGTTHFAMSLVRADTDCPVFDVLVCVNS